MARVGQTPVAATTRRKVRDRATTWWGGRGSFPSHLWSRDGSLRVSRVAADFEGGLSPAKTAPTIAKVARIRDSPRQSAMHGCEVRAYRDETGYRKRYTCETCCLSPRARNRWRCASRWSVNRRCTRPQRVITSLARRMACHLDAARPLPFARMCAGRVWVAVRAQRANTARFTSAARPRVEHSSQWGRHRSLVCWPPRR